MISLKLWFTDSNKNFANLSFYYYFSMKYSEIQNVLIFPEEWTQLLEILLLGGVNWIWIIAFDM